jgi:glycosyltransferase involved in cell wall biosynthesis
VPSRWEGLPLVALEAMARARSLVCSDIPGLAEIVEDGAGAAVPPDDPKALAAAIVPRLTCPDGTDAEGRAAAGIAAQHDLSRTLDLLAALTLELAAVPATTPVRNSATKAPQGLRPKSSR